jgi:hypothetical protein
VTAQPAQTQTHVADQQPALEQGDRQLKVLPRLFCLLLDQTLYEAPRFQLTFTFHRVKALVARIVMVCQQRLPVRSIEITQQQAIGFNQQR